MKRERGLVFLVPEGRFSGGQEGDSWWDENRTKMPKACIYAGFRHLFYQMALVWLYLWAE